jgi:radical SAM superfamily enzyme YgiQ (UPF0313 family)
MSVNALIFTQLIHGETCSRGLGAYRIATEIRKAGYTCQVIEHFTEFSEVEMKKIMSSFIGEDTLIVGFSSTFFMYIDEKLNVFQQIVTGRETKKPGKLLDTLNYPYHWEKMQIWFQEMKKLNPKLKIVFGGSKSQYLNAICDAYAIGYADQSIINYMKFLEGKNPFFQFKKINENQILFNGDTSIFDFTKSTVEWHETDHLMHGEAVPIEIARGCIFKCKFCSYPLNGKKKLDYIKDEKVLRDEFLKNYYEHGITRYMYADDTHNDTIEKLQMMHRIVTSLPFELEYTSYLRLDLIHAHKETASLLRESGLRSTMFGIESLNYKSARSIGKGLHPEKVKETLYWLKEDVWKNEVAISASFIVGLPHDTPETVTEWSKWLLDSTCPIDTFYMTGLRLKPTTNSLDTKLWNSEFDSNAEKYGYIVEDDGYTWRNTHYTHATAEWHANQITNTAVAADRFRCAGFPLFALSNSGFKISEMMGSDSNSIFDKSRGLRSKILNEYTTKLLKQINYEIPIRSI